MLCCTGQPHPVVSIVTDKAHITKLLEIHHVMSLKVMHSQSSSIITSWIRSHLAEYTATRQKMTSLQSQIGYSKEGQAGRLPEMVAKTQINLDL